MSDTAKANRSRRLFRLVRPFRSVLRHPDNSSLITDLSFVILGVFALYLALAIYSYDPSDISYFATSWPHASRPKNLAGQVGAELAAFCYFFLGLSTIFIPPMVGWSAYKSNPFKKIGINATDLHKSQMPAIQIAGSLLFLLIGSAVFAIVSPDITIKGVPQTPGGMFGQQLSDLTLRRFGNAGGILFFVGGTVAALILFTNAPILERIARKISLRRRTPSDSTDQKEPSSLTIEDAPETRPEQNWVQFEEQSHLEFEPESTTAEEDWSVSPSHRKTEVTQYNLPPEEIFKSTATNQEDSGLNISVKDIEHTAQLLVKTFNDFGVTGRIIGFQPGPVVTVFEFQPDAGVKQSRVLNLIDDLALALKVDSIFINPVPGKRALGVQVPNVKRETVFLGDLLASDAFKNHKSPLVFAMGKSLHGQPVCADLTAMPHLLMAGATGAGKSVAINSLICSVVMKSAPADVKMILVDPKMLELSVYEGIPHLLMPVITEPDRASHALKWAAAEMERRYRLMQHASVRNIAGFNSFWDDASESRRQEIQEASGSEMTGKLPYILLVIDELADLMLTAPKDVESSIQRLAQKARASGIHMVLATQRPSVDIITGVIKANLPCRLSFQVVSKHDSRTILDQVGAEKLLGRGDMLFQRPGTARLERIQGTLVSDEEVLGLVANLKASGTVGYDNTIINWIEEEMERNKSTDTDSTGSGDCEDDPKYSEAIQVAKSHGVVSASFLQRNLKIGYNRAARIVEHMERCGLVAKADGAKPRRWLGPSA